MNQEDYIPVRKPLIKNFQNRAEDALKNKETLLASLWRMGMIIFPYFISEFFTIFFPHLHTIFYSKECQILCEE